MKALYVTSVEGYSGKTATCLALGIHFKADGFKVNYLKPLSLQPWRVSDASGKVHIADEDASFAKTMLELPAQPWELSPVVITSELLDEHIQRDETVDFMPQLKQAFDKAAAGQDILLLEGGASMREGYVLGLPTIIVAQQLDTEVLVIVRYHDLVQMLDDVLAVKKRLGKNLLGVIINRVPDEARAELDKISVPYIEKLGVPVFGIMPEERGLAALTVGDLIKTLEAEVLTKYQRLQALVENMTVGAMTAEAALSRFRRYPNKAVITGGDRTDIQLAALETSTTCLVLTGNLRPSPLVVKQAEEFGVTVVLTRLNTMETIEAIEHVYGKTRLGEIAKLKQFQTLLDKHCNFARLYQAMGIKK